MKEFFGWDLQRGQQCSGNKQSRTCTALVEESSYHAVTSLATFFIVTLLLPLIVLYRHHFDAISKFNSVFSLTQKTTLYFNEIRSEKKQDSKDSIVPP